MSTLEAHGSCPLCGSEGGRIAFPYATRWKGRTFEYRRCLRCASTFVSPLPTSSELDQIYSWENYHAHHYGGPIEEARHRRCLELLDSHLPKDSSVLDFGCGTGAFMAAAAKRGMQPSGIEYETSAIEQARESTGFPVSSLSEALIAGERLQALHICDVIAHLPDPAGTCRALETLLEPGGLVLVAGPLESNASLVHWVAAGSKRLRRLFRGAAAGEGPPTMLVRTNWRAQREFFCKLGWRELHFEVTETGWPYRLPGGPPDHSPRSLVRHTIGSAAIAMAWLLRPLRLGNRFIALYRVGTQ